MEKFSQVVTHISAHEARVAGLDYDPVGAPQLMEPLLVPSAFTPAQFDEALFFDLFRGISADAERAISSLFRVYIDGMLSPEHENSILASPPRPDESLQSWLDRVTSGHHFGVIINGAEQWSDRLARMTARLFSPITESMGRERTNLEVTLFIGNYGYTPFGIHIDNPYTTVVHFHVGPANKEMTLFDKADFHRLNGPQKNCFTPETLIPHGRTFTIRPGDLFVLPPHYYHVGNTPSFSVAVAVAISKYPPAFMTRQVLNRAVAADSFGLPLDALIARAAETKEGLSDWIRRSREEFDCQVASRRNLRYSYQRPVEASLSPDTPLLLDPDFPLTHVELGDDLLLFARGNRIRLARTPLTRRLVVALCAGPTTLAKLHEDLRGEISADALRGVVQQLVRFGAMASSFPSTSADKGRAHVA